MNQQISLQFSDHDLPTLKKKWYDYETNEGFVD
jgi:hypothetical protein